MSGEMVWCPYCGSGDVTVCPEGEYGMMRGECLECGAKGPPVFRKGDTQADWDAAKAEAIAVWNRRAGDPAQEG